jgi:hypothetical protein
VFRGWRYLRKARDRDSQSAAAAKRLLFLSVRLARLRFASRPSLSLSLSLSVYPRNHIGKYGAQLKAIQRDHALGTRIDTESAPQSRGWDGEGGFLRALASYTADTANLIAVPNAIADAHSAFVPTTSPLPLYQSQLSRG